MFRSLIVVCVLIILGGCTVDSEPSNNVSSNIDASSCVVVPQYNEGAYAAIIWLEEVGTLDMDDIDIQPYTITNKEDALKFSSLIMSKITTKYNFPNYEAREIYRDNSEGIWIVSFNEKDVARIGGNCNIAFTDSSEILRVWLEE